MIQPRIQLHMPLPAHDNFTRAHNLVIGYFADIIIADIITGQRN